MFFFTGTKTKTITNLSKMYCYFKYTHKSRKKQYTRKGDRRNMNRTEALAEVKRRYAEYLQPAKKKNTYICPICQNGTGETGDGIIIDPKGDGTQLKCFKCGFYGDIVDLYQQEYNCDFTEAYNRLCNNMGLTEDKNKSKDAEKDFTEYYKTCRADINKQEAISYLKKRGISKTTADKLYIGYDKEKQRIIIPASNSYYLSRAVNDTNKVRYENPKGATVELFNKSALYSVNENHVYITEGVFDALAFIEAGREAIALNSTSNINLLLKALENRPTDKTLLLCLDNDETGKQAQAILVKLLKEKNISYRECNNIFKNYKDAGEAIADNREAFINAVKNNTAAMKKPDNAAEYLRNKFAAAVEMFKGGGEVKTGFSQLDFLSGGVYNGLYVIGGISSVGKTTFTHQLADNLASNGSHVLFFSLEQSKLEIISKSLARGTYKTDSKNASTSLQIRKGKQSDTINKSINDYMGNIAENMNIIEGNFNCTASFIKNYAKQYIEANKVRPIIVVDYLQIMQPEVDPETKRKPTEAKQIADYNITALKRITRDLDLPVFVISSVNRSNYLTEIDFESFKESGGIEYTADVVWGLQLQAIHQDVFTQNNKINEKRQAIKTAKAEIPRKIELVCLKNRYGEPSYSVGFEYMPQYDYFREEVILNPWEKAEVERKAEKKVRY